MTHRARDVVPFNRDRMHMVSRDRAAVVAHEVIAAINATRPEEQMVAVAIVFATLVSRFRLDPQDMHILGRKLLQPDPFHRKGNSQMDALEAYAHLQATGQLSL